MVAILLYMVRVRQKYLTAALSVIGNELDPTQVQALSAFPMPVMVVGEAGEIIWYNDPLRDSLFGGSDHFGEMIGNLLPEFDMPAACRGSVPLSYGGQQYTVFGQKSELSGGKTYVLYFICDTQLKLDALEYRLTRPAVLLIAIDNYEEILQMSRDSAKTQVFSAVDKILEDFVGETSGFLMKTSTDRYIAVIEERHMRAIVERKFEVLDKVRTVSTTDKHTVTISIGVGRGERTLAESLQTARRSLDMALGRGGDQATVKAPSGYEFYGGRSRGVEKRTKVKTRVIASALSEVIQNSDQVFLMGHGYADLDSIGSAVGLWRAATAKGRNARVVVDRRKNLAEVTCEMIDPDGSKGIFISPEQALAQVTKNSLLIIVDTHLASFSESPALYEACRTVVVVDHHRRMVGYIDNAVIFYHEPYVSSTCEMVAELLQYMVPEESITREEAQALLAGITLDTKNFVLRTGVRTFEAAGFLRKLGADTVAVKKMFSIGMESYQKRAELISSAQVYRGCALAFAREATGRDMRVVAAQAADELLSVEGVDASFVFYPSGTGVNFSARSLGDLNVQLIMERLGGGGHMTMAGAYLKDTDLDEGTKQLRAAIDDYFASLLPAEQ